MTVAKLLIPTLLVGLCLGTEARATVSYLIVNSEADLGLFDVTIDGVTTDGALAGGIQIKQTGTPDHTLPPNYTTICTDISGSLYLGSTYTYDSTGLAFNGQTGVKPTWGSDNTDAHITAHGVDSTSANYAIQNAAYLFYHYAGGITSTGLGGSAVQMEALQLAVWDVLYDTDSSGNVTGSRFTFAADGSDGAVVTAADGLLSGLTGHYSYSGALLYPNPDNSQNNPDGNPPQELLIAVPEPSTLLAGALLALPFGATTIQVLRKKRGAS